MSTRADEPTTEREPDEADLPEAEIVEEPPEELTAEERIQRERDEYYESWRRSQADLQNFRRRQAQVLEAATNGVRRELLSELLLVLDYLDMALLTPVETTEGKNLLQGVKLTRGQLMQLLGGYEVEPIEEGDRFDPALHEAVETVTDTDAEPGTIVATIRKGYRMGKDVLRYAHVKVAAEARNDDEETEE